MSWPLGSTDDVRAAQGPGGLAIDQSGSAWFGINDVLFEVSPTSTNVRSIKLSSVPSTAADQAPGPPEIQRIHAVSAVAVHSGEVALAFTRAAVVELVDAATGDIQTVALPARTESGALGFFPDGTLAVGLKDDSTLRWDEVFLIQPSLRVLGPFSVPDSSAISPRPIPGTGRLLAGNVVPTELDEGGSAHATAQASSGRYSEPSGGGVPLPDGRFAAATPGGVAVRDPQSGASESFTFPTFACGPLGQPDAATCPSRPRAMTVDSDGNLWFVTNGQAGVIGSLRSGSY